MIHLLATWTKNWRPLVDLVAPLWEEYAGRHPAIDFQLRQIEPTQQHISFPKTGAVAHFLEHHLDFGDATFVIDLDMIPTNMNYDLARTVVIGNLPSCGVVMGKDINGWNSGAYFIDDNPWARGWLKTILALGDLTTSEQHAMWLINEGFGVNEAQGINSIPYHEYEGFGFQKKDHYSQWEPGHFICHLPGMTMAKRIEILQKYIPLIQR